MPTGYEVKAYGDLHRIAVALEKIAGALTAPTEDLLAAGDELAHRGHSMTGAKAWDTAAAAVRKG